MSFDSGMYMAEEGLSEVIGTLITAALSNVLSFGVAIFAYVFGAISLYCIAQRRGIKNPWMAWVPVLNCWILGSISDQYRYVVKGQVRNRRTLLLVLKALQVLGCIAAVVMAVVAVVQLIMNGSTLETMSGSALGQFLFRVFLPMLVILIVTLIVAVLQIVFLAIAYYDLFASCEPENKVLYLVLGLLINITLPIFLFICRKKDLGMPARKSDQPAPEEIPVMEAPAEPWTETEE